MLAKSCGERKNPSEKSHAEVKFNWVHSNVLLPILIFFIALTFQIEGVVDSTRLPFLKVLPGSCNRVWCHCLCQCFIAIYLFEKKWYCNWVFHLKIYNRNFDQIKIKGKVGLFENLGKPEMDRSISSEKDICFIPVYFTGNPINFCRHIHLHLLP